MKFTLEIELGNAEMQSPDAVAAALSKVALKLAAEGFAVPGGIRDENGNTVGVWQVRS